MTYGTIGAVEVRHLAPKKVYFALYLGKKQQNYYDIFLAGKVRDCWCFRTLMWVLYIFVLIEYLKSIKYTKSKKENYLLKNFVF